MKGRSIIISMVIVVVLLFSALSMANAANSTGNEIISPHISGQVLNIKHYSGINGNERITIMISLKYRNQYLLDKLLSDLQNPDSILYHKYLSQQEFTYLFSPTPSEYFSIANYFIENGFSVSTYSDRISISVTGTYSQFSILFNTKFGLLDQNGLFIAPVSPVHYYGPYISAISNIVGLNNEYRAKVAPLFVNSNGSQLLYGSDMQTAYQLNKLYTKGYPTGSTIVTILWAGNDSSGNLYAPFVPSDISNYFNNTLPANEPKPAVYGYPVGGAPSPGPSAANDPSQANFESTLDLEMAGSTAPGSTIVEVYGPAATENYLDEAFAAALNNGSTFSPLKNVVAISNSWGGQDSNDSTWMQYEQEAAARGITVLASSGDDGNTNSAAPSFPATMAYNNFGTLAVGGAEMTLSGSPSTDGSGTTGIASQAVWYNSPQSGDGSQGGVSSIFSEPNWQVSSPMANSAIISNSSITGVSSGRGVPDVAADGANMSIYITTSSGSGYQTLWGTSVASPLMAGLITTIDFYIGSNEGFINPLIYKLGQEQANGSFSTNPPFYFIYNGSNGDFSSANGYSLVVGWGTINAYNFVLAQQGSNVPSSYTVTFTENGLSSGTSWSVTFNGNSQSSTTSSISYSGIVNGSYSFTIGSISGYTVNPSSGTLTVNGANVNQAITFSAVTSTTSSAIYSEVNSSSISTYTLPEAEEFTVGSVSETINFVKLYLSGSGTIAFSIGSSLWGSNILSNTTINVNGNQLWYNTSIPSTNLAGSTNYYLNVYQVSGNVQWGYTSTPSSNSKNYVQDYWYSSGTLTNDNSYPDIYAIGYSSAGGNQAAPREYSIIFSETGLNLGSTWAVSLNNQKISSTNSSVIFYEINGTYDFSVSSPQGYTSSPATGSVSVSGSNMAVSISFSKIQKTLIFSEVNATPSNIYVYQLPESEEFTIGNNSTASINFVSLYMSGSGEIEFSIGTSLWSSNILANVTVNISSTQYWYNTTISSLTLSGGTDYYLNVYLVSGNVNWGYTSSPTIDINAIQDFYYSGGTLYQDNSYPDIFVIGYA